MEAESVPPAFRACLGPLPEAVVILPRAMRRRDQRGIFEQRPRTGCCSPSSFRRANAPAVTRAIPALLTPGSDSAAKPDASGTQHPPAAAALGTRRYYFQGRFLLGNLALGPLVSPLFPEKLYLRLQQEFTPRRNYPTPPQWVRSPFQPPSGTYSRRLPAPGKGQAQVCGIPRLGGVRAGERAVTLWSLTPRYPSSGCGPAGARGLGGGLLSADGCALPVAAACCCCGGRSFWPPRLLYTSNKLVHMVVSAKHTARPWRCRRAGESRGEPLRASAGGARRRGHARDGQTRGGKSGAGGRWPGS